MASSRFPLLLCESPVSITLEREGSLERPVLFPTRYHPPHGVTPCGPRDKVWIPSLLSCCTPPVLSAQQRLTPSSRYLPPPPGSFTRSDPFPWYPFPLLPSSFTWAHPPMGEAGMLMLGLGLQGPERGFCPYWGPAVTETEILRSALWSGGCCGRMGKAGPFRKPST